MKATELLKSQHKDVKDLFDQIEESDDNDERSDLFEELAANLVAHDAIEREIFYPACEQKMGMSDQLGEALVEHGVVEFALYNADQAHGKPDFIHKVKVLREVLEHHIEEEEKEFFPETEKALGKQRLEELGEKMESRFAAALDEDFRVPLARNLEQVLAGALKPNPRGAGKKPQRKAS
jgi:hemerythrin superfamily protein